MITVASLTAPSLIGDGVTVFTTVPLKHPVIGIEAVNNSMQSKALDPIKYLQYSLKLNDIKNLALPRS
jgi:hypothetical protein